jgi:hypothetical protein
LIHLSKSQEDTITFLTRLVLGIFLDLMLQEERTKSKLVENGGSPKGSDQRNRYESVDVWFDDGTLVVRAGETLFRVYGGILSASSPVLRDMLSLAIKREKEEMDGCPVVCVSDNPADMSFFLKSLHDVQYVPSLVPYAHIDLEQLSHNRLGFSSHPLL